MQDYRSRTQTVAYIIKIISTYSLGAQQQNDLPTKFQIQFLQNFQIEFDSRDNLDAFLYEEYRLIMNIYYNVGRYQICDRKGPRQSFCNLIGS